MSKITFLLLFFLLSAGILPAQRTISGRVLQADQQKPIAYASIGIGNTAIGTISNKDGSFLLRIPEKYSADSLRISSIGYHQRVIGINHFKEETIYTVNLTPRINTLHAVQISSRKDKKQLIELGNRRSNGGVLEADTTYSGRTMALLIDPVKDPAAKKLQLPAWFEKAQLKILRNNLDSIKFRIRLNEVDPLTGLPGEDILSEDIIVSSRKKSGWLTFDLSHLYYEITGPFFLCFEQILDLDDRSSIASEYREFIRKHPDRLKTDTILIDGKKEIAQHITRGGIDLAGTFIAVSSHPSSAEKFISYERETSFAEWKRVRGIMAATVTLSSQLVSGEAISTPCIQTPQICEAERICLAFMEEHNIPGLQIAVGKNNRLAWSASYGNANIESNIPVNDSTRFRINSISKSVTSLALINLIKEKGLDLDLPIQQYLPQYPAKKYSFSTRQLAGHLAGFRDYKEDDPSDYIRKEHYANAIAALTVFRDDTLLFQPGTRFHYSTFGWNLIGAIIEQLSGQNYVTYMQENIWNKYGMLNTSADEKQLSLPNRSSYYDAAGVLHDLGDLSYKYPGGGLLSTATDLVTLGNNILFGKQLDLGEKQLLFESQRLSDGRETGYGLGWYTGKDKKGHRIWYHAGDSFGGSSYLVLYPDDGLVISFLANSQAGVNFDINQLGELFYKVH